MDKTVIKNFAIWARNKLISDISYRAGLMGITEEGIANPLSQSTGKTEFYYIGTAEPYSISGAQLQQRKTLVEAIRRKERDTDYQTAYKYIMEEVAYTWFNRLIAVRFMEVNDYLPSHIRVLSSETGKLEPDLVTTPFDAGLHFNSEEEEAIVRLKQDNQLDELFRILFIKQCNELNNILPELFEHTGDYTELLLNLSVIDQDGVVYHLVHDLDEADFDVNRGGQVEITGWLYQYYNTDPKDETFALLKKNVKVTKERIPSVTQLFTPDWIVRYMVENSLGRLWLEGHPNDDLKVGWKYYLDEAEQEPGVLEQLEEIQKEYQNIKLEDIKIIDPCMGSGHILVYVFDVLMQIYATQGYAKKDAVKSILENNLYGLDIDDRAAQLAYFAVMMKARSYDRCFFELHIRPHVYSIRESSPVNSDILAAFGSCEPVAKKLIDSFIDAKEYGSLLTPDVTLEELATLQEHMEEMDRMSEYGSLNSELFTYMALKEVWPLKEQAEILSQKYDVVVTNPPYMRASGMNLKLSEFVKKHFPDSKSNLFSVFIERCGIMIRKNSYQAMITQQAWMFHSSYRKLREKVLLLDIINMLHLGAHAFEKIGGEIVQTTAFIIRNSHIEDYMGGYCRLIEPITQQGKEDLFLEGKNQYTALQRKFSQIPGSPVAYWVGEGFYNAFEKGIPLEKYANARQGMKTCDTDRFIRFWHEVSYARCFFEANSAEEAIKSHCKWFPINHGGPFCAYYGDNYKVVNWENDGAEMKELAINKYGCITRTITNIKYYFKEGITWTVISSELTSFRRYYAGHLFSNSGQSIVPDDKNINLDYLLGLLNSKVVSYILSVLAPSMGFESGYLKIVPIIENNEELVTKFVLECISISKFDWDSFEVSWDFCKHPLVRSEATIASTFAAWQAECNGRFNNLKANMEELNQIFIDIYGLQDELSPKVGDREVTVHKADLQRDIRSLLSYAVGCMFGRYSLDVDGLAYAGGEWDVGKYKSFLPDCDNIIPITDAEYLEDDIVSRLCQWLKVVYGEETLENNLDFIAEALGGKGDSSREIIRKYFLKGFYKDHCRIYQKCPIYWLFDSGKQNGFKALIYLHRYTPDDIGNMRTDYLHRMQRVYDSEIARMQEVVDYSSNSRDSAQATKRKEKLQKQLKECRDFDEQIGHLALSRINLDLDDGVIINYEKLQTAQDGKMYSVLAKI